uniref:Chitin-binding type-2 domain-containing protein n=1 Tax=Stomoxys calcitrans TaxID=35570 RepID=A0A1I8QDP5_STOCA
MNFVILAATVSGLLIFANPAKASLKGYENPWINFEIAKNENAVCANSANSYHADPKHCRNFIECINGIAYRRQCASDMYWNQKYFTCVWSSDHCKDNNANVCANGEMYHADAEDCHYFIQCSNGTPHRKKCAEPLFWKQQALSCVWTSDHCEEQMSPSTTTQRPTTTTTPEEPTTTTTLRPTTTTTEEPTTTTTLRPITTTTEEPTTTTQRPTSTTTTTLGSTTPTTEEPTTTTTLRPTTTTAEEPTTTTTTPTPTSTTTECPTPTTTPEGTIATDSTTPPTTTENPPICKDIDKPYHADPYDCEYYIECIDGQAYRMKCPNGLNWNQLVMACVLGNEHCSNETLTTTTETTTPTAPSFKCGEELSYHSDPNNCTNYIQCLHGIATIINCPFFTYWEENVGACVIGSCQNEETTTAMPTTISTTTEAATTANVCSDDISFHADPQNCTQFIQCYEGNPFTLSCPEQTYWNISTNACVIGQCEVATTTEGPETTTPSYQCEEDDVSYHPDPNNCKNFIQCLNGTVTVEHCPQFTYWEEKIGACVVGTCQNGEVTTVAPTTTTTVWTTSPTTPSICGEETSYHGDPENCTQFIECYQGNPFTLPCPEQTYWNISVGACVKGYCEDTITTEQPELTTPSYKCGDGLSYHPDPNDCTNYIQCLNGMETILNCPQFQYWNERVGACVAGICHNEEGTETTSVITTTTTESTTTLTTPSLCDDETTSFHPHPYNCRQFIQCYMGSALTLQCPDETYWNVSNESCDFGHCDDEITSTLSTVTTQQPIIDPSICEDGVQYLPDHYDCHYLIECINGVPVRLKCGYSMYWDQQKLACVSTSDHCDNQTSVFPTHPVVTTTSQGAFSTEKATTLSTPSTATNICEDIDSAFLPHPNNCTKFIQCFYGITITRDCPPYTYWDVSGEACVKGECPHNTTEIPTMTTEMTTTPMTTITQEPTEDTYPTEESPTTTEEVDTDSTTQESTMATSTAETTTTDANTTTTTESQTTTEEAEPGSTSSESTMVTSTAETETTTEQSNTYPTGETTTPESQTTSEKAETDSTTQATSAAETETTTEQPKETETTAANTYSTEETTTSENQTTNEEPNETETSKTTTEIQTTTIEPNETETTEVNTSTSLETTNAEVPNTTEEPIETETTEVNTDATTEVQTTTEESNKTQTAAEIPTTTEEPKPNETSTPEDLTTAEDNNQTMETVDEATTSKQYTDEIESRGHSTTAGVEATEQDLRSISLLHSGPLKKATSKILHIPMQAEEVDAAYDAIPIQCSSTNQFIADPKNCHQFYACHNGRLYLWTCGSELYWDSQENVCSASNENCSKA